MYDNAMKGHLQLNVNFVMIRIEIDHKTFGYYVSLYLTYEIA